jgi:AcrR family transcriptional regulator
MPEWIPTRASAKGRLVLAALEAFGRRGYHGVGVAELAEAAETTTGPLYHHFGSKLGLYDVVRSDVEQRILDRMEGALAVPERPGDDRVATALVVAFDYAVRAGVARLLSEPHPGGRADAVADLLTERLDGGATPLGAMLAAAWRAAVAATAEGMAPAAARSALLALRASPPA